MARLYSNENFPFPVVLDLRSMGHDVLTSLEAGRANQRISDEHVLAFATAEARALLTLNRRHFIQLHKRSDSHAGIIVCTVDADYFAQATRIHEHLIRESSLTRQLIRINRGN